MTREDNEKIKFKNRISRLITINVYLKIYEMSRTYRQKSVGGTA
jgi:hypothetical protein